jgi:hypothetical protein
MANYSVAFVHAAFSVTGFLFEDIFKSIKCSCNANNVFPIFNKCGGGRGAVLVSGRQWQSFTPPVLTTHNLAKKPCG